MKCFHHNDADGKCAAYWVKVLARRNGQSLSFVEMDYTKPFPFDSIEKDERVYIVDFSIMPDDMRKLLEITQDVTWIDHHKTAIERYEGFEYDIRGIRGDGIAGCMLTWIYLSQMTNYGEGPIALFDPSDVRLAPSFTQLIADWDVWRFKFGEKTRQFIIAFNALNLGLDDKDWPFWDRLCNHANVSRMVLDGATMLKYRDGWAANYMNLGFECNFEGYSCFAVNIGFANSEYFKSLEKDYDIWIAFVYDGSHWRYSLYSTKVDVSEIAKKYGGGGHRGAAGFTLEQNIFEKE